MAQLKRMYNQGAVDSRDRDHLSPGEMQTATGVYYKPGDPHRAHKIDGRSTFGDTTTAKKIDGLELLQFDAGGTDKLVALSNSVLYGATPGATGTFTSLFAPSTSPTSMDSAHANNRHYLALGTENRVIKSDGTTRAMGMQPPPATFSSTTNRAGGIVYRPDADNSGFTNPANGRDALVATFAHAVLSAAGSDTVTYTWATQAGASNRNLLVAWELGGVWVSSSGSAASVGFGCNFPGDSGASASLLADVTVKFEVSEDGGASFSTSKTLRTASPRCGVVSVYPVAAGTDLVNLQFRVTFTYNAGAKSVALRLYDVKVQEGGSAASNFNADGILYAFTERDESEGIESIPSPPTKVTMSTENSVELTLPAVTNSNATTWRIWRTPDNGTITQLGLIGELDIGDTVFVDDFIQFDVDTQPPRLVNFLTIRAGGGNLFFLRDFPPPNMRRIEYFKGSLVGLPNTNTREMAYSVAGFTESWPEINSIKAFPLPEHDELVDIVSIGQSLIIGANDAMLRMDELPRSVGGAFIASNAEHIKGAPGVIGKYAMAAVNYRGISNCAWISPENGVLITDGDKWETISDDVDWTQFDGFDKSNWILRWVRGLRVLLLAYSSTSGGANDRYMIMHLDKDHLKPNGQAKITWPHYGAISSMTSGQVASTYRVYEGHYSDGKVYQNFDSATGADSSNALDASGTNRLLIKGPRNYEEPVGYQIVDANLHHSDFGAGQTATVSIEMGRDASGSSETISKTVALNGHKGTRFNVLRAGEWSEETITHDGTGRGSIKDLNLRVNAQGHEGSFRAVN